MTKTKLLQIGLLPDWDQEPLEREYIVQRVSKLDEIASVVAAHGPSIRGMATRAEFGASAELINSLPNLEVISVYGVGYDAVNLDVCRERGIHVSNTPGVLTEEVADFAVAMMLVQARSMVGAEAWVRNGNWADSGAYPLSRRAYGKRAGVLGLGHIGRAVADRLAAFKMDIAYSSRAKKDTPGDWAFIPDAVELAEWADFLFLTISANSETRHIVDKTVIEALGANGTLINVARASVIDEEALLDALEDGRLGNAALDVFEGEPTLNPRFVELENVLLQPHHGSATTETRMAMGQLVRDNLESHFAGHGLLTPVL